MPNKKNDIKSPAKKVPRSEPAESPTSGGASTSAHSVMDADVAQQIFKQLSDQQNALFASFQQQQTAQLSTLSQSLQTSFSQTIAEIQGSNQRSFHRVDNELKDLADRVAQLEAGRDHDSKKIDTFANTLQIATTTVPIAEAIDHDDFNRAPDLAVIRLRATEEIPKRSFLPAVEDILQAMSLTVQDYKLEGPAAGKNASIRFNGDDALAKLRAKKFIALLKNPDGSWKQFFGNNTEGEEVQIWCDFDKNRCTLKSEMLGRRLAKMLRERFQESTFSLRRNEHTVFLKWLPIVKVTDVTPDDHLLKWNLAASVPAYIRDAKDDISEELRKAISNAAQDAERG